MMMHTARNAFNLVIMVFLLTFIGLNIFALGKYFLSSQGLI